MTTETRSALEQEAAAQGAVEMPPYSSIEFSPTEYQKVTVYLSGNEALDDQQIGYALARYWHGHVRNARFAEEVAKRLPAAQPAPAQQPQGVQRQPSPPRAARGNTYPPDNMVSTLNDPIAWTCDKCGGTGEGVARRPQKGNMSSDAIVCLNSQCKEGQYRYTIAWDDGTTEPARSEDDLPF